MKKRLLIAAAFAAATLSGCVTYDHVGARAPGGYYQGSPQVRYYDAYGNYYPGGVTVYGGYGYGSPYYYGRYRYPYYGYYGPYYPYYRPHHPPPRPGHDHHGGYKPPPGSGPGGSRPAPWRDPTNGAWRESGQTPMVPGHLRNPPPSSQPSRVRPANPGMPPRATPRPTVPRMAPPSQPAPRAVPRSYYPRTGGKAKTLEP